MMRLSGFMPLSKAANLFDEWGPPHVVIGKVRDNRVEGANASGNAPLLPHAFVGLCAHDFGKLKPTPNVPAISGVTARTILGPFTPSSHVPEFGRQRTNVSLR